MICQSTYDSLDAIPETLREEFMQVNGKWQLKDTAIPGVGTLFNAALAANEAKAVDQVKKRNDKIRDLEGQLNAATDKLSVLDTPGSKSLSKADSELWDEYNKLGTPKEIAGRLTNLTELQTKVEKFETSEGLAKITQSVAVNAEVLTDWATGSDGKGLAFFVKEVETTDAKGVKAMVATPFVRIETTDDKGKTHVQEKELLPFAKETLPSWKYEALISVTDGTKTATTNGNPQKAPGVKLPDFGSTKNAPPADDTKKKPVDIFNERRDAAKSPFASGLAGTFATAGAKKI